MRRNPGIAIHQDHHPSRPPAGGRGIGLRLVVLAGAALALSACGIHVSKTGISGTIAGHSFSGAKGSLPAGFPSSVPLPDQSRVLGGGGTDNHWDVALAATGVLSSGTAAYRAKLEAAGYTTTTVQSGSVPDTGTSGAGSSATTTKVTVTGDVFTAKDAQWSIDVVTGTTTASTGGTLKAGEFAVDLAVVPTSSVTSST